MYAVISVIVNVRSIFEWYKLSWKRDGPRSGVHEKGLLLYTAIVFFSTVLMCSQQVTVVFASFTSNDNLYSWAAVQVIFLVERHHGQHSTIFDNVAFIGTSQHCFEVVSK
ncbi:hypothetical protein V3C99_006855 [Haemonchus contortus]|uniref:7TM_GPCR_Srx domain-containing protein n=1 Tax=Haemonchus contortus TaxID=6289 RepID=A0A7I4YPL9_HAECO